MPPDRVRFRTSLGSAVLLLVAACGPEPVVLPPTGIYHFEAVTLDNACHPLLDDDHVGDEVVVVDPEYVLIPAHLYLGISPTCEHCAALTGYGQLSGRSEPEPGRYLDEGDWYGAPGCEKRKRVDIDVTSDTSLRALITEDWRDAGACTWAGPAPDGCTVVREYTYTLVQACDDCEFPLHKQQ